MIIKKIMDYGRDKGFKALTVKLRERIRYKIETDRYMRENVLSEEKLERQSR